MHREALWLIGGIATDDSVFYNDAWYVRQSKSLVESSADERSKMQAIIHEYDGRESHCIRRRVTKEKSHADHKTIDLFPIPSPTYASIRAVCL